MVKYPVRIKIFTHCIRSEFHPTRRTGQVLIGIMRHHSFFNETAAKLLKNLEIVEVLFLVQCIFTRSDLCRSYK